MGLGSLDDPGLKQKRDDIGPSGQAIFPSSIHDGVTKIDGQPIADMPESPSRAHAVIILSVTKR